MLTRRSFITSTIGAGAMLATQGPRKAAAQADRRLIVDAQVHLWKAERSEEHTSELQSRLHLVCRLLLETKRGRLMATLQAPARPETRLHKAPFVNEPFTDFSQEENARIMRAAIEKDRAQLGREYDLINGVECPMKAAELFALTLPVRAGTSNVRIHVEDSARHKLRKSALKFSLYVHSVLDLGFVFRFFFNEPDALENLPLSPPKLLPI